MAGFLLYSIPDLLSVIIVIITYTLHTQLTVQSIFRRKLGLLKVLLAIHKLIWIHAFSNHQAKFFIVASILAFVVRVLCQHLFVYIIDLFCFCLVLHSNNAMYLLKYLPAPYHLCNYFIKSNLYHINCLSVLLISKPQLNILNIIMSLLVTSAA